MRLFYAIELGDALLDLLDETTAPLRAEAPELAWVPREKRHLTLKFFGDVEETDDHVGLYLGVDGDGNKVFHSSRKTTNGPTFGPLGGVSYLNGDGYWALASRRVRRF